MATPNKSLSEQIDEIMVKNVSKCQKQHELLKLGLPSDEIFLLLNSKAWQSSGFDFSRLTFGVEIECYNFARHNLMATAANKGLRVESEEYNHHDNRNYYKIVSDSSLQGENSQEVVSPILAGNSGLESLKRLCGALAEVDAKVNKSCGLHVHIGAAKMSDAHYCHLVLNYQALEAVIDTFMPVSRRANNSRWCHTLQGIDFSQCSTKRQIAAAMNYDRYFKVNAQAYGRHQTVEFRQHSGTTDYEKISHWVLFLAKLVEYSEKHTISQCSSIEEIPFLSEEQKQFFIGRRAALN